MNIFRNIQCKYLIQGQPFSLINKNIRCIALKVVPEPTLKNETHDEKNMRLQRALSPHLTIYKYQLTSVLSITHRFTGISLTGYAATLGLGALVLPYEFSHYVTMIEGLNMSGSTLAFLKAMLAFPAAYHTWNGVRHLLWDKAKFLTIKQVYTTGYLMLAVSFGTTILLTLL